VVRSAKNILVSFPSGEKYSGDIIVQDVNNDVAIVVLRGMDNKEGGFIVNMTADVDPGMEVNAIGYPLNSGISIVSGKISSSTGLNQNISKFTMTAPINEGNSGGPVIDSNGNLVGIAQGGLVQSGVENVRFGTKIATTVFALKQAKLTRQFSIQVVPKKRIFSSREIFKKFSPYVVRIDVKK
jgi:S1-C subfamily serine protease